MFAAFTLCALVVYRRRQPVGIEKWLWRAALTAYALLTLGVALDYWTQWTGRYNGRGIEATLFTVGYLVTFPALLLTGLTSTTLGVALLLRRFRPLVPSCCWPRPFRWPCSSCSSPRWGAPCCP